MQKRTSSGHPRTQGLKGLSGREEFLNTIKENANVTWLEVLTFLDRADRPVTSHDVLSRFKKMGMVSLQDASGRLLKLHHWRYAKRAGKTLSPSGRRVNAYAITDLGKARVTKG